MSKDLYVKNLSQQTTEEDIRTLFAVAGKVTYIHMVVDPKTEQFLGCAYVKMSSEAEAKDALNALNEARYMNSYISVSVALPRTPAGSPRPPQQKRAARPPAATGAQKKQERSIAKGDWTGPAPAKKKALPAATPRRQEGAEGRSDWTSAPAGGKKPREKSIAQSDWTVAAGSTPSARRKSSSPPRSAAPKKGPGSKRDK
jgi:RNA recognition motif-containing protein